VYFFDVAPHNSIPDVKFYLPTRRYGPDDRQIALRLMEWMKARGRGKYCEQYLHMMETLAEHRGLENGKGLHTYISYQIGKSSEPDIKSYLTPETYHPARFAP
jgi:DMATS type aromatic prenyltransferase